MGADGGFPTPDHPTHTATLPPLPARARVRAANGNGTGNRRGGSSGGGDGDGDDDLVSGTHHLPPKTDSQVPIGRK